MDMGREIRKAMQDARREAEKEMKREAGRDVQRKMDQFGAAHQGHPVETIRTELATFWRQTVGQNLTDAQLQETAQAIHNGECVPTQVGRVIWQ